ncbi:hypothetical protein GCM10009612_51520 [Streptomyces beijiangensis]
MARFDLRAAVQPVQDPAVGALRQAGAGHHVGDLVLGATVRCEGTVDGCDPGHTVPVWFLQGD